MTAANIPEVAAGVWAAWHLGLPLNLNGRQVFISDDIIAQLFPNTGEPESSTETAAPLSRDWTDPKARRELARRCCRYMAIAEQWITTTGIEIGALGGQAVHDGSGDDEQAAKFSEAGGLGGVGAPQIARFIRGSLHVQFEKFSESHQPAPVTDSAHASPDSPEAPYSASAASPLPGEAAPVKRLSMTRWRAP